MRFFNRGFERGHLVEFLLGRKFHFQV